MHATRRRDLGRRRFPRFQLDVDWFVKSPLVSALGRGLELSAHGALLPASCAGAFVGEVTLYLSLPAREKMFEARCTARQREGRWLLLFEAVSPADLQLLAHTVQDEGDSLPDFAPGGAPAESDTNHL